MVVNTMKASGYLPEDIAHQLGRTVGSVRNVYYGYRHADVAAKFQAEDEREDKPSLFHMILTILGIRK